MATVDNKKEEIKNPSLTDMQRLMADKTVTHIKSKNGPSLCYVKLERDKDGKVLAFHTIYERQSFVEKNDDRSILAKSQSVWMNLPDEVVKSIEDAKKIKYAPKPTIGVDLAKGKDETVQKEVVVKKEETAKTVTPPPPADKKSEDKK